MKLTLLQLTQNILSSLNSDEVNSISDTPESLQVAEVIRTTYFNIVSRVGTEEHYQLLQLDPSLDPTTPVMMYVPQGVSDVKWIKYFNSNPLSSPPTTSTHGVNVDIVPGLPSAAPAAPGYTEVRILPVEDFLDEVSSFNIYDYNVATFTFNDASNNFTNAHSFNYKVDQQPSNCCIISNFYVIFDSYDRTQDTTLQASKSQMYGQIIPVFTMSDNFVPNLAEEQFPLLLNEAKSLAFFEIKQSPHPKAEQEAKRGWGYVQKNKSLINRPSYFDELANFGRRGHQGSYFRSLGFRR